MCPERRERPTPGPSTRLPADPLRVWWFIGRLGLMLVGVGGVLTSYTINTFSDRGTTTPSDLVAAIALLAVAVWDAIFLARRRRHVREGRAVPVMFDALDTKGVVVTLGIVSGIPAVGPYVPTGVRIAVGVIALTTVLTVVVTHRVFRIRREDLQAGVEARAAQR